MTGRWCVDVQWLRVRFSSLSRARRFARKTRSRVRRWRRDDWDYRHGMYVTCDGFVVEVTRASGPVLARNECVVAAFNKYNKPYFAFREPPDDPLARVVWRRGQNRGKE